MAWVYAATATIGQVLEDIKIAAKICDAASWWSSHIEDFVRHTIASNMRKRNWHRQRIVAPWPTKLMRMWAKIANESNWIVTFIIGLYCTWKTYYGTVHWLMRIFADITSSRILSRFPAKPAMSRWSKLSSNGKKKNCIEWCIISTQLFNFLENGTTSSRAEAKTKFRNRPKIHFHRAVALAFAFLQDKIVFSGVCDFDSKNLGLSLKKTMTNNANSQISLWFWASHFVVCWGTNHSKWWDVIMAMKQYSAELPESGPVIYLWAHRATLFTRLMHLHMWHLPIWLANCIIKSKKKLTQNIYILAAVKICLNK